MLGHWRRLLEVDAGETGKQSQMPPRPQKIEQVKL